MIKFHWINAIVPLSDVETLYRYQNLEIGYVVASFSTCFDRDTFPFRTITAAMKEVIGIPSDMAGNVRSASTIPKISAYSKKICGRI